jgi:CDP-paratose 2-epimerase
MKVLVTGICGFAGSVLARELSKYIDNLEVLGIDNLSRPGSEQNRHSFRQGKVRVVHGDIRNPSDIDVLPKVDWVIDAAANPSVLAGLGTGMSSRQVIEHNLLGTVNLVEFCKRHESGLVLLSTSRVYSSARLCALPMKESEAGFVPQFSEANEAGLSERGISESFSTQSPLSLYGCAKLASELLILEYASAFRFPVRINRCGVLAGAGQFGKPDQGIFSYWIHSYRAKQPLKYIGFKGTGHQVRDCLHPRDLASLVAMQIQHPEKGTRVLNVSGGMANSISLARLSDWCGRRFGSHQVTSDPVSRPYDVPWLVLDSALAESDWNWRPATSLEAVLSEIADHAEQHPSWLDLSKGT